MILSLYYPQNRIMIAERQVMEWFIQVTMALRYIHGKRVLHRDLKTQNVFLTKTNMIKIGKLSTIYRVHPFYNIGYNRYNVLSQ